MSRGRRWHGWPATCGCCPPGRAVGTICSDDLARAAGVNPAQAAPRPLLPGQPRHPRRRLRRRDADREMSRALGAQQSHRVALVGVGNLGRALAGYSGFRGRGFTLGRPVRRRPGQDRPRSSVTWGSTPGRTWSRSVPTAADQHRRDRHPAGGRAGCRRRAGGGRCPFDPELRAGRAGGAVGCRGPAGRPRSGTADARLPRGQRERQRIADRRPQAVATRTDGSSRR